MRRQCSTERPRLALELEMPISPLKAPLSRNVKMWDFKSFLLLSTLNMSCFFDCVGLSHARNMEVIHEVRLPYAFVLFTTSTHSYLLSVFFEKGCSAPSSRHILTPFWSGMGAFLLSNANFVSSAGSLLSVTMLDGIPCFSRRHCKLALAPLLSGSSNLSTST